MSDQLDNHPLADRDEPVKTGHRPYADVVAWVAIALGAVLLFAGYWGASDSTDPGRQIPYLASGTVPGLALVIIGCGLAISREHSRDRAAVAEITERFDAILDWLSAASPPSGASATPVASASDTSRSQ